MQIHPAVFKAYDIRGTTPTTLNEAFAEGLGLAFGTHARSLGERVVADIDEIVRLVRFPGWQGTQAGEREVKKALRKALFKYKLHADEELFEKAFGYVREYY